MPIRPSIRRTALALAFPALAGCATVPRPALPPEDVSALSRRAPDLRLEARDLQQLQAAPYAGPYEVLALSGGGPDGAFGVGFLTGLQQSGRLPEFAVITGVSTGALMAPFLFAGPEGLTTLKAFYTAPDVEQLVGKRSILRYLRRPGFVSSKPLNARIEAAVDMPLMAVVAREHQRGRRLFVATVNLDSQRLVQWDMGAIALKGTPAALNLFRQVLLAAISIPLAMDPVAINVGGAGPSAMESHVDASLVAPFHLAPELLPVDGCSAARPCRVSVILHNKLVPEPRTVPWRVGAVAARTVETVVKSQLSVRLREAQALLSARGATFRMSFIDVPFPAVSAMHFDPDYMGRLYEIGLRRGHQEQPWSDMQ